MVLLVQCTAQHNYMHRITIFVARKYTQYLFSIYRWNDIDTSNGWVCDYYYLLTSKRYRSCHVITYRVIYSGVCGISKNELNRMLWLIKKFHFMATRITRHRVFIAFSARSTIHHNYSALRIPHYSAAKRDTMWMSEDQVCEPPLTRPHRQNEKWNREIHMETQQ